MVRADAGTGIGFEIRARAKRRVAVDGLVEIWAAATLLQASGLPLRMPGTFIISPRPKKLWVFEQRLCLTGINEGAFILEGQGRNTGRHHELHDKREVPAGLDEPVHGVRWSFHEGRR